MSNQSDSIPAGFGPDRYGNSFADVYDEWYGDLGDEQAIADFVDRFGEGQRVLELGVGTGRLSTPLAERGHQVVGVDASTAMLERFRPTEGSHAVGADMAEIPTRNECFDTVLVATNTLFNLHKDDAQQRCIAESRRVLRFGGRLIIEAMVPGAPDPALDRLVTTRALDIDRAVLTATIRDSDSQLVTGQHIEISESGIQLRPWRIKYSTLDQLDEMALSQGFRLGQRTSDWAGEALSDQDSNAVSVYVAV